SSSKYLVQDPIHAVRVRMLGEHVLEGVINQLGPVAVISKPPHNVIDVGIVLAQRYVVSVGLKDAVVVSLEQYLAGLGSDGFEVDVGDEVPRARTFNEEPEKTGSLLISKCERVGVQHPAEADVDRAWALCRLVDGRIEGGGAGKHSRGVTRGVQPPCGLDWQLAGDEFGSHVARETDLFGHPGVFVAEEDDQWASSTIQCRGCTSHLPHAVARRRVQDDDQIVVTNPPHEPWHVE